MVGFVECRVVMLLLLATCIDSSSAAIGGWCVSQRRANSMKTAGINLSQKHLLLAFAYGWSKLCIHSADFMHCRGYSVSWNARALSTGAQTIRNRQS